MAGMFPGWRVVIGSGCGIAFGSVVFAGAGFAQLASAWGTEFHWTPAELAKAATIYLFLQMVTFPLFGWLLDRWGSRCIATASIALFGLSLIVLSQIGNSLTQFYAAFALIGVLTAGTNVVSYARALSLWFDKKRGLALGLAASAQAIGAVLIPTVSARIIASSGWSNAVLTLAAVELLVCLPLVWLLVRDSPVPYGLLPDGASAPLPTGDHTATDRPAAVVSGMSRAEVLRSVNFWKLALCFLVMGMTVYGVLINVVFILGETAKMSAAQIATVQSIAGVSVLVGRIGFGWLLDRFHAPLVSIITLLVSAAGLLIYANAGTFALVLGGALLLGCSIGGESDLMPYLASRYFGTRSLSSVFGWFLSLFFVGAAIGPTLFASLAGSMGSWVPVLYIMAAVQLIPLVVFLTMGAYPGGRQRETDDLADIRAGVAH